MVHDAAVAKHNRLSKRHSGLREKCHTFFKRGILTKISSALVIIFILIAIYCPYLTPYTPYEQSLRNKLKPWSKEHWLGTDNLGRDVLTRVLYGARISIVTGVLSSLWAAVVGAALGLTAGYSRGFLGSFLMRLTDAHLSIPPLILVMVLAPIFGRTILGISIVIGISAIPSYVRMVYGQVLSLRENDYVTAASVIGQSNFKILLKHLLPNCIPVVIVMFTSNVSTAITIEANLAYIGIGIRPPTPAWGVMISEGYNYLVSYPHLAIAPGIMLMLLIISLNVVGDGIRDVIDPRLRGKL